MKTVQQFLVLFIVVIAQPSFGQADEGVEAELAAEQAFRAEFQAVVDDLNAGSFEKFIAAIDKEDMVERIFGLRLIDQRVKKQFREDLEFRFEGMIKSGLEDSDGAVKATLLGFESRGDRGRAVVRFDLPKLQYNYNEYDLRRDAKGRITIVDWVDFLRGERYSDGVGTAMVMAAPSKPATRKLIDFSNVKDSELFQMTELLKAARDRRAGKYFQIVGELSESLQRQRIVILTGVQLTKQVRDRRRMRTALLAMAKYFPQEPLYSLMLLDYYFPARRYEDAMQALLRLQQRLGVEDAAMNARLSAAALVMENVADADAYANTALQLEPDLELGWWSALRARAALSQFDRAVEALQKLEHGFGHVLGPEELQRDPGFAGLLASEEYKSWVAARQ